MKNRAYAQGYGLALAKDAEQEFQINMETPDGRRRGVRVSAASHQKAVAKAEKDNPGFKANRQPDDVVKDMADRPYGQRVRIKPGGGMKEFHGKTGQIISKEGSAYRVRLDQPVDIPGVGKVEDDLWEPSLLSRIGGG